MKYLKNMDGLKKIIILVKHDNSHKCFIINLFFHVLWFYCYAGCVISRTNSYSEQALAWRVYSIINHSIRIYIMVWICKQKTGKTKSFHLVNYDFLHIVVNYFCLLW